MKNLRRFVELILASLCFLFGAQLFWVGILRLLLPNVMSKSDADPVQNLLFLLMGACILGIGILLWAKSKNPKDPR